MLMAIFILLMHFSSSSFNTPSHPSLLILRLILILIIIILIILIMSINILFILFILILIYMFKRVVSENIIVGAWCLDINH